MYQILTKKQAMMAALSVVCAGSVVAAPALESKSATMQCVDRHITVEAACFSYAGPVMMCNRQAIRFTDADGKALGARVFKTVRLKNVDYPVVPEQFGELTCIETKDKDKFVAARMGNGGNCDECEWVDVYSVDGVVLGSTRDGKRLTAKLDAAVATADGNSKQVLNHKALTDLYLDRHAQ